MKLCFHFSFTFLLDTLMSIGSHSNALKNVTYVLEINTSVSDLEHFIMKNRSLVLIPFPFNDSNSYSEKDSRLLKLRASLRLTVGNVHRSVC